MKIKIINTVFASLSCLALSCSLIAASADTATQKDGEIIALMVAVNNHEISAANEALNKTEQADIKEFAELLKNDHTRNLEKTMAISKEAQIAPFETESVVTLQNDGKNEIVSWTELQGADFNIAYINAMVKGHKKVLEIMDDYMLKNVNNQALKDHIMATRPHVQDHLQKAEAIQKKLNS